MMIKRRILPGVFLPVLLLLLSGNALADKLTVAAIFSNGMVLQRQMEVPVWGTAEPGDKVKVVFGGQTKIAKADSNGKWVVKLDPLKVSAEGRKLLIVSSTTNNQESIMISDVLVGEVWLCAGQSNMAWTLAGLTKKPGNEEFKPVHDYLVNEIATANDPLLRFMFRKWIPAVSPEVKISLERGIFSGASYARNWGFPLG